MSVVGIGTDLVAVERIEELLERHPKRWLERCFRLAGSSPSGEDPDPANAVGAVSLAGRWAAKEAFLKALGTNVRGIPYRDIEVVYADRGSPELVLHGRASEALTAAGGNRILLSISLEGNLAMAAVLIEQ